MCTKTMCVDASINAHQYSSYTACLSYTTWYSMYIRTSSMILYMYIVPVSLPTAVLLMQEWDGLLRVCFVRKNKTLSAIFRFVYTYIHIHGLLQHVADRYNI